MIKHVSFVGAAFAALTALSADAAVSEKPLTGSYMIYSGDLGDTGEPTAVDAKVFLSLDDDVAKALFAAIPGKASTNEDGTDIKEKGDISCMHFKSPEEWACYAGFDLHTGKSISSTIE